MKIFDKYIPKDESEEEEKDEDDWTIEGLREELEGSTEGTDSEETVSDETAAPAMRSLKMTTRQSSNFLL